MPRIPKPSTNGHALANRPELRAAFDKLTSRKSPVPGRIEERPTQAKLPTPERTGIVGELEQFIRRYIVLPEHGSLVVSTWILAAWQADAWERFPHLLIESPEKRCGKTTLLRLLELLTPHPVNTTNISAAAIYRLISAEGPAVTLMLDEAQSLSRRGSESSEVIREVFCAAIDRNAQVLRVGGKDKNEVQRFACYCPKIVAMIGEPDAVLADRCLPIEMRRKTNADKVERFRSRVVEPASRELRGRIEQWATDNAERAAEAYDTLDEFEIRNDRLAELLMPLQAVLEADGNDVSALAEYADRVDAIDDDRERQSPGVRLLAACREIFSRVRPQGKDGRFIATSDLIEELVSRDEEPWRRWIRGGPISAEELAKLLRPFGIRSCRNRKQTNRGYVASDFAESWSRYLGDTLPETPSKPSRSSKPSENQPG